MTQNSLDYRISTKSGKRWSVCPNCRTYIHLTSSASQRWPGHVKARHFVLALRDFYRQQAEAKKWSTLEDEKVARISDQDEWTLEWITINKLQAIAEAFDDDASGFITVAEVNKLTSSRPKEWRYVLVTVRMNSWLILVAFLIG